jgi:hypothetical protein
MSKKVLLIILSAAVVLSVGLAAFAQPAQAEPPCGANETPFCADGIQFCPPANINKFVVATLRNAGFSVVYYGACVPFVAQKTGGPAYKHEKWVRFEDVKGRTGSAGWGWVTFRVNNVVPTSGELKIDDVGTFDLHDISCPSGRNVTCTATIMGVPFTGDAEYHGGRLAINGKYFSSASKILVPMAP